MVKSGFARRMVLGVVFQGSRRIGHAWVERASDGADVDPINQGVRGLVHEACYRLDMENLMRLQRAAHGGAEVDAAISGSGPDVPLPEISWQGRIHYDNDPRHRESG